MRRADVEKRLTLRRSLVEIAEGQIERSGVGAVKARDLAVLAACAVGAIYTFFPELDALIAEVNMRTLARLEGEIATALPPQAGEAPKQALSLFGQSYLAFAAANSNLWSAAFGPRKKPAEEPQAELDRLIALIVAPLRELLPGESEEQLRVDAKALFSAVHGIVSLSRQERLFAVPADKLEEQIAFVVETFCDGLSARTERNVALSA